MKVLAIALLFTIVMLVAHVAAWNHGSNCVENSDCPPGQVCEKWVGVKGFKATCELPPPIKEYHCLEDSDCPPGQVCKELDGPTVIMVECVVP